MGAAQLLKRTLTMVRDLSVMLEGRRDKEIDGWVKAISSELTSIMHKREYFRSLSAKYLAVIEEYRANQDESEHAIAAELRQAVDGFLAGTPLSADGQLSFEMAVSGPSGSTQGARAPTGPACAAQTHVSGVASIVSNSTRPFPSTAALPFASRTLVNPPQQTVAPSGGADVVLAEVLTPEFLMECTPNQIAALEPLYQRLTTPQEEPEPSEEEKRRMALAAKFPAIFAQPTPRAAPRTHTPVVDARRALNFATPGTALSTVGSTVGRSALTAGTQLAASVVPPSANQSMADMIDQKLSAALALRDLKVDTSISDEDKAFVDSFAIAGAVKSGTVPECKVPIFKRGNRDMTIENWFFQMRNFFETYSVDSRHWVNMCITRIHTSHFKEIAPLVRYNYTNFRSECIKLFESPDLTQAYLSELTELAQAKDEDYESYYERVRELISKAHPSMAVSERESLMVSYFIKGLYDSRVRDVVASTPGISLAEALRRASSVAASRRRSEPSGPPVRKAPTRSSQRFRDHLQCELRAPRRWILALRRSEPILAVS